MLSTVLIGITAALLCAIALILGAYLYRLCKDNKSKRMNLGGVFLAIGFIPMALVVFADMRRGGVPVFSYIEYLRSPLFMADMSLDMFLQVGQLSFLIDFFSGITFTTIMLLSAKECVLAISEEKMDLGHDSFAAAANEHPAYMETRGVTVPYVRFCRYLS